ARPPRPSPPPRVPRPPPGGRNLAHRAAGAPMGRVLGVDVSLGRGLDVALGEGGAVKATWRRLRPDGLAALLDDLAPDAVAIDAPPRPGLELLRDADE